VTTAPTPSSRCCARRSTSISGHGCWRCRRRSPQRCRRPEMYSQAQLPCQRALVMAGLIR
jgi:hypothetical protein